MPPPTPKNTRWFAQKLQPHEPKLRAWLTTRFPKLGDVDDLIQETYVRVFRSNKVGNLAYPQAYLFMTARNAAVDQLRRLNVVQLESLDEVPRGSVIEERPDAGSALNQADEIQLLGEAIESLPTRCRIIFKLRKLRGLSYEEISRELDISVFTINAQLAVGLAKVREYLRERGVE